MFKEYKDERINELIKKSFELAVRDDEWKLRYLQEWNILFEDIDKMLEYVENGYKGELRVNSNMWWVLQETLRRCSFAERKELMIHNVCAMSLEPIRREERL